MKLPLKLGIPALLALWIGHGFVEDEDWRTLLLVVAMGVALWTAFSLNIPRRQEGDELDPLELEDEEEDGEDDDEDEDAAGEREPDERDRPLN